MYGHQVPASDTGEKQIVMPFLRWAGGKRWLLHRLPEILGSFPVENYHEPFLGGASMFFGVRPGGTAFLSDLNEELIETYVTVRDAPADVWRELRKHENTEDFYYDMRAKSFKDPVKRTARFIYLNHTSFNGIYRVNLRGQYNVPFGHRQSPKPPTLEHLLEVSDHLEGNQIQVCDFECALLNVRKKDLVFLDPPYTVAHNNNGFVKYNQKLFSFEDQRRLARVIEAIRKKGAYYILTNAAHDSISDLFDRNERRLEIRRRNNVGGKAAKRGNAAEYLFTKVPNHG